MKKLLAVLVITVAAQRAMAAGYVRVLLPLYIPQPVPGAYGSLWQTHFAVHNGSPLRSYIIEPCPDGCSANLFADEELVPNETETELPVRYPAPTNGIAGAVLYLSPEPATGDQPGGPADNASSVAFELRIADSSRSAIAAGTELPVIRESEFRTSMVHLLNIPTDPKFRLALRIFEMNLDRADFTVRVLDQATNALLASSRVTTLAPAQPALRFAPGFVELNNISSLLTNSPQAIRVEVEPVTSGSAFWAYVSITNNDSQQITLVTPQ